MKFEYGVAAALVIGMGYFLWKAWKTKDYYLLLCIPFLLFFASSAFLGGSAFHDAETDYELYEAGHYYLCSHGNYTEVTHGIYLYMKIMEPVGICFFVLTFISQLIRVFRGED